MRKCLIIENYSFSKIKNFNNCKSAYFRNYFLNDKDKISNGTSEFGTFSHEILEKYAKKELEVYEVLSYYLEHYDENVKSDFVLKINDKFSKDFSELYFESGKRYFQSFNGFEGIKIIESEYEFKENLDDKFYLIGKIDLIGEDEKGDLILIDHKSKSRFKNKKEKDEYMKQLYLYSYGLYKKYNKFPKKIAFNMFRINEMVFSDFEMDKYKDTIEWVKNEVEEIENCIDFNPNGLGSFYCDNFCPYRHNCKYKE